MAHPWAVHNGEIVPVGGIRLSAWQTGLLSGWGLFSTLRIYQGVPFALEDHIARLRADAQRLQVAAEEALAALPKTFAGPGPSAASPAPAAAPRLAPFGWHQRSQR